MKKQIINEQFKRMQKLAGILNENVLPIQDKINTLLSSNTNPELDTFIQPVKFMIDQSFSEDVDINTILEEAKDEMEFQLERANNNKDLRLIFARVEAMLTNY